MRPTTLVTALALSALLLPGCGSKQQTTTNPDDSPTMPGPATVPANPPGPSGANPPGPNPPGPAGAQTAAASVAAGKAVFAKNCSGCHGANGAGIVKGTPNFTSPAWQAGEKDDELVQVILNGHEQMPAFKDKLTEEEIRSTVVYLRTFAKNTTGKT